MAVASWPKDRRSFCTISYLLRFGLGEHYYGDGEAVLGQEQGSGLLFIQQGIHTDVRISSDTTNQEEKVSN